MQLFIDYDKKLSRYENKITQNNIIEREIDYLLNNSDIHFSPPIKLIQHYYTGNLINDFNNSSIFGILTTKPSDIQDMEDKWFKFKEFVENELSKEVLNQFEPIFLNYIYNFKGFDGYQKMTIIIDDENYQDIIESINENISGSLFEFTVLNIINIETLTKEISISYMLPIYESLKDKPTITIYSTINGIWQIKDKLFTNNLTGSKNNLINYTCTYRQLRKIENLQDFKTTNYVLYSNLEKLFNNEKIKYFSKTIQQPDLSFKNDLSNFPIVNKYYKLELDEEEIKSIKETLLTETSHIYRGTSTVETTIKMLEKNKKEIHIDYSNIDLKDLNSVKTTIIKRFFDNELKKKREELELLEYKIKLSEENGRKAKQEFIQALISGNTIFEAINIVKSAKYSDMDIEYFLQELRVELINSAKISQIANDQSAIINRQEILIKTLTEANSNLKENNRKLRDKNNELEDMIYKTSIDKQELFLLYEDAKEKMLVLKNMFDEVKKENGKLKS